MTGAGSEENSAPNRVRRLLWLKRIVFALLWLALIAQAAWMVSRHTSMGAMWYPLTVFVGCLLLAATMGRVRWTATLLRLIIGLAFLEAVADRFGLLGAPGTAGVAWGNFANFTAYTSQLNWFLPGNFVPTVAVLATIFEIVLGFAMLLGIRVRKAAIGSAVLLFLFATAMTIAGRSQFMNAVYLMCVGALALAIVNASLLSVDALTARRKP